MLRVGFSIRFSSFFPFLCHPLFFLPSYITPFIRISLPFSIFSLPSLRFLSFYFPNFFIPKTFLLFLSFHYTFYLQYPPISSLFLSYPSSFPYPSLSSKPRNYPFLIPLSFTQNYPFHYYFSSPNLQYLTLKLFSLPSLLSFLPLSRFPFVFSDALTSPFIHNPILSLFCLFLHSFFIFVLFSLSLPSTFLSFTLFLSFLPPLLSLSLPSSLLATLPPPFPLRPLVSSRRRRGHKFPCQGLVSQWPRQSVFVLS